MEVTFLSKKDYVYTPSKVEYRQVIKAAPVEVSKMADAIRSEIALGYPGKWDYAGGMLGVAKKQLTSLHKNGTGNIYLNPTQAEFLNKLYKLGLDKWSNTFIHTVKEDKNESK